MSALCITHNSVTSRYPSRPQKTLTTDLTWAGAARTLACALVVLVHINIYIRADITNYWPGGIVLGPIFGLAVPTFFMLSGFFDVRFSAALPALAPPVSVLEPYPARVARQWA